MNVPVGLSSSYGGSGVLASCASALQRLMLRLVGPRLRLLPRYVRQVVGSPALRSLQPRAVVRGMRALDEWAPTWSVLAEQAEVAGDWAQAGAAWRAAALGAMTDGGGEMIARSRLAYLRREDAAGIEVVDASFGGASIPAIYQHSSGSSVSGVIVVFAGKADPKESYHRFAREALGRGYSVLRVDLPDRLLADDERIEGYIGEVRSWLSRRDPGHSDVHLLGTCIGGSLALLAATEWNPRTVTVVSAIASVGSFIKRVPPDIAGLFIPGNQMIDGFVTREVADALGQSYSAEMQAPLVTCPVRLYHGALDILVPATEMSVFEQHLGGEVETCLFLRDGHTCVRNRAEIFRRTLEWITAVDAEIAGEQPIGDQPDLAA